MKIDFAPTRNKSLYEFPWEGSCSKKPWDYKVTAVIPFLDTFESLEICIELLRLQTEAPYIVIVDTGSNRQQARLLERLRADDLEVHTLRFNGVFHPSDFPAMAMDLGFSICRTPYLFATHADCFLRKINLLEELVVLCEDKSPVVGYEITPRSHSDWPGMISHTASMYKMEIMDKIGFGWSMRRLCNLFDIKDYKPNRLRPGWPDTELLGNYILRLHKIKPHLIGKEVNFQRTKDENIDHFRSYTSGKLYNEDYFQRAKEWYEDAKKEAKERMKEWKNQKMQNK